MDNLQLVKHVTEVRLNSDVNGAASLAGALANKTDEKNRALYNKMIETMAGQGYCPTCAQKTIEYFIRPEDTS